MLSNLNISYPASTGHADPSSAFFLLEVGDAALLADLENAPATTANTSTTTTASTRSNGLSMRGHADDEAVLCTANRTFRLRKVQTSNLFLLAAMESRPEDSTLQHAHTAFIANESTSYLEAVPCAPRTDRLGDLLRACPYEGLEAEQDVDREALSLLQPASLIATVQASDAELAASLSALNAIVLPPYGCHRILGPKYICRFFEIFFATATLEDWDVAQLDKKATLRFLAEQYSDDFSPAIIEHIMNSFAQDPHQNAPDTAVASDKKHLWELSGLKVCRFFATQLLTAQPVWKRYSEFERAWSRLIGDFAPEQSLLRGLALLTPTPGTADHSIQSFPADSLPIDPAERFRRLFQACTRWDYSDIVPYVEALTCSATEMDALILAHGRVSTNAQGKRVVTPRSQLLD